MRVREITKPEFDAHRSAKPPEGSPFTARRYFAFAELLAVLIQCDIDHDWTHVVLGKDRNGLYRAVALGQMAQGEVEAVAALCVAIRAQAGGDHSQGDEEELS